MDKANSRLEGTVQQTRRQAIVTRRCPLRLRQCQLGEDVSVTYTDFVQNPMRGPKLDPGVGKDLIAGIGA